ncbi:MAG: hypothetical protein ACRC20_04905 [Segniliparus sp.]|uniref:hypothetical protein n=1 Tax=Segniliparus sp. TaxID=2804064 RepID=UPI003F315A0E
MAFLAGVEESTVGRLWAAEDWLDRIKGKTLQSLVAILPGVAEYMVSDALKRRRRQLVDALGEVGLHVDPMSFRRLVAAEKVPEQVLANTLSAALYVMRGDAQEAARHLARFWNRSHDRALGCLWKDYGSGGVFTDPGPLIEASSELVLKLAESGNSYHAMLGHATLAHHIAKATGHRVFAPDPKQLSRRTVMSFRSMVIGRIIQTGDLAEVRHYGQMTSRNTLLGMVERWSFPTYNRDATATTDFSLPGSVLLRNTAVELLGDLGTPNEAYFFYLVAVAVPLMLQYDPTLGLKASQVGAAVVTRMETCVSPVVRQAGATLLGALPRSA